MISCCQGLGGERDDEAEHRGFLWQCSILHTTMVDNVITYFFKSIEYTEMSKSRIIIIYMETNIIINKYYKTKYCVSHTYNYKPTLPTKSRL